MSEREQQAPGAAEGLPARTTPDLAPVRGGAFADPAVPGWGDSAGASAADPGWGRPGSDDSGDPWAGPRETAPDYSTRPVALRRPDAIAGLLAVLAGIAAAASLPLRWVHRSDVTGWTLVRDGIGEGRRGLGRIVDLGYWEPLAVVVGGGALLVLGLLLFLPARTHRTLGGLALLAALAATAGVLAPLAQDGWQVGRYDVGMWLAAAVAGLGLLAGLKALLTGPRRSDRAVPG